MIRYVCVFFTECPSVWFFIFILHYVGFVNNSTLNIEVYEIIFVYLDSSY